MRYDSGFGYLRRRRSRKAKADVDIAGRDTRGCAPYLASMVRHDSDGEKSTLIACARREQRYTAVCWKDAGVSQKLELPRQVSAESRSAKACSSVRAADGRSTIEALDPSASRTVIRLPTR